MSDMDLFYLESEFGIITSKKMLGRMKENV